MTPDGKNDMILSVPAYLPGRYAGCADMAELADATVLGAVFERSAGSSPVIRSMSEQVFYHLLRFFSTRFVRASVPLMTEDMHWSR